jgi:ABC-2 type transport system permease protein
MKKYSQLKATLAITKASLKATFRDPSAVVFGLLFPFIFILIFGFLGNGGGNIHLVLDKRSNQDQANEVLQILKNNPGIDLQVLDINDTVSKDLEKGTVDGILYLNASELGTTKLPDGSEVPAYKKYDIDLKTTEASPQADGQLVAIINSIRDGKNIQAANITNPAVKVETEKVVGRKFKTIDFILPGQLGFSLLSIGVFGTAFVFVNLRETLVLKRFFATPIKKSNILIGEGISKLAFAMVQGTVIIGVGTLFMGYTLVHGVFTLLAMLFLAMLGLIIFMGFGFIISGLAKTENTVPPLANIVTLPQFLLSGTFFATDAFPSVLKAISNVLPLTYLNEAMRKVAFEGASIFDVKTQILVLFAWAVGVLVVAVKLFKWGD